MTEEIYKNNFQNIWQKALGEKQKWREKEGESSGVKKLKVRGREKRKTEGMVVAGKTERRN